MRRLMIGLLAMVALQGFADEQADRVEKGRAIAWDRNAGNCLSCHMAPGAELPGNVAPPLMQMKLRYPDRDVLVAQIYDARDRNPQTVMPPYGAHGILSAEELELVVDYVYSL